MFAKIQMCALTEAGVIYTYQSVGEEKVTIDGGQRQGYYINTSTIDNLNLLCDICFLNRDSIVSK